MNQYPTIDNIDLANKKVLLRADLNVPLKGFEKSYRVQRLLPTIEELIKRGSSVVIISHYGRPKGFEGIEGKHSLKKILKNLSNVTNKTIKFGEDCISENTKKKIKDLKPGEIILLENTRFYKEEKDNVDQFAKKLSEHMDIYINDAFSCAHRAHASNHGIVKYLPSFIGRMMEHELSKLNNMIVKPQRPILTIIGGAKISSKIPLFENLLKTMDKIFIAGGMANTFLEAQGYSTKKSLFEKGMENKVKEIFSKAEENNCKIILPIDAAVASEPREDANNKIESIKSIPDNQMILDIGPKTIVKIEEEILCSKTIVWNGPLGVYEVEPFNKGTKKIGETISKLTREGKITSLIGGGDTASALQNYSFYKDFSYISTGGGAFLEWLEGKELPGLKILKKL